MAREMLRRGRAGKGRRRAANKRRDKNETSADKRSGDKRTSYERAEVVARASYLVTTAANRVPRARTLD